ncbi:hypothetical protein AADA15_12145 [Phycobacter sp. 'Weihai']
MTQKGQSEACAINGPMGSAFQRLRIQRSAGASEAGRVIATYCIGKLTGGRDGKRGTAMPDCPFLPDFAHP